ncbi:hypothetical protein MYSTI_04151 [Myxococcus stipitatus DSM 14675]|uniref:Uncharacterized protein n=1 Tax=Myxococcus stipitatus (strain DSM 14675 / JCM 12634 / Mx s8) TaxID=1278073 RepID=L7U969_MYXSD|nr:hypothetical protein [Myxococcus stipitatus]AGC45451.1 hypothetical protein MYSTI_04151 [Myxococcus stipitatus DSM 14675]
MSGRVDVYILPGGAMAPWGGRRPATACEEQYARALSAHAVNRSRMVDATQAEAEARKACVAAIAEHGPCSVEADAARRRWDAAHARTLDAAARLEAATLRIQRAMDAWASEVAAREYARAVPGADMDAGGAT